MGESGSVPLGRWPLSKEGRTTKGKKLPAASILSEVIQGLTNKRTERKQMAKGMGKAWKGIKARHFSVNKAHQPKQKYGVHDMSEHLASSVSRCFCFDRHLHPLL